MKPPTFLTELRRRNVYRVAVAYALAAWLLIQVCSILLITTFEAPAWIMKVIVAAIALGFPVTLAWAWAFEITPEGVKRTEEVGLMKSITRRTGRKLVSYWNPPFPRLVIHSDRGAQYDPEAIREVELFSKGI